MTEIDVCHKLTWLSHGPIQECKKEGAQLYPQEFRMARIYFRLLFICAFIFSLKFATSNCIHSDEGCAPGALLLNPAVMAHE